MVLNYDHLLGQQYVIGINHCWKLCRDFYRDCFGIELGDYSIPTNWNSDQLNLIEMIYEREGFSKVSDWTVKDLQPGDLLCVAVHASNPNHFVVFVGENTLLHHPLMQLSRTEPWRDFWRNRTCFVLRHKDAPKFDMPKTEGSIQEIVRARYSLEIEA